jgi:hypothetical protein
MHVVVGIVGYYGFVRGYPLGPELLERLHAMELPGDVDIREMNWGPVAIVQDFQVQARLPDRVVLVGALDRGLAHGSVTARHWVAGPLDVDHVQRRMFEAVTGIVSLDNLLVIGSHFGIWPDETYTVELQWPDSGLGDLVLDEAAIDRAEGQVVGERPLTAENERIVARLAESIHRLVASQHATLEIAPLTAAELTPLAAVASHRFVDDFGASGARA